MRPIKVFLHGRDRVGWSIDYDRKYTEVFLTQLGYPITSNPLRASVIHSVWWNLLLSYRVYFLRWKKMIASATNEINIDSPEFLMASNFVNLWIVPSQNMYQKLRHARVDVKYQPFYVDEKIFIELKMSKKEIAQELGIDYEKIRDKLVIGSFQRDSLGANLSEPKWQKNPELMVDIMCNLPKDEFILLLAGPRRHWIINRCKKSEIPYLYHGKEPEELKDDIKQNTLDKQTINKLYNLTDLYIVTSKSEGGPKAVLESAFTRTMILSTNVGLAPDFLNPWCIYSTAEEAGQKIREIAEGKDTSQLLEYNYDKAYSMASYKPVLDRWKEIYEYFEDTYLI